MKAEPWTVLEMLGMRDHLEKGAARGSRCCWHIRWEEVAFRKT